MLQTPLAWGRNESDTTEQLNNKNSFLSLGAHWTIYQAFPEVIHSCVTVRFLSFSPDEQTPRVVQN